MTSTIIKRLFLIISNITFIHTISIVKHYTNTTSTNSTTNTKTNTISTTNTL